MRKKDCKITCIACPIGCEIKLRVQDGKIEEIESNHCSQGIKYAKEEFYNPQRVLTTTIRVRNGRLPLLPVRTDKPLAKGLLRECMRYLAKIEVQAPPIKLGQVIVPNILNSRVNIIFTRELKSNDISRKT